MESLNYFMDHILHLYIQDYFKYIFKKYKIENRK